MVGTAGRGAEPGREAVRAELLAALRLPRAQASEEVNWLLVRESRAMRQELAAAEMDNDAWQGALEDQMSQVQAAPSARTDVDQERQRLGEAVGKLAQARERALGEFDARRTVFAQMLQEVRDSAVVRLAPEASEAIRALNAGDYLAGALGMSAEDFQAYYGTRGAQSRGVATHGNPAAGGIDFSRSVEQSQRIGSLEAERARLLREQQPRTRAGARTSGFRPGPQTPSNSGAELDLEL